VSKINKELRIRDREWQPSVVRLIQQLKVPVVPIYFHGHNSTFFNILGLIDWRLRTLRLPREVFLKTGKEIHVSIGNPISPEEIARYSTVEELGKFLKQSTYDLEKIK
jgi:putative hemolysin